MNSTVAKHVLVLVVSLPACLGLLLSYLNPQDVSAWVALWSICG